LLAHRRAELEFYKKLTKDSPETQKQVLDLLDGYLKRTFDKPDAPSWAALNEKGDALSAGGAKDPFFLSALGAIKVNLGKIEEGQEIAKAAFQEISSLDYPPAVKLKACARWRPIGPRRAAESDPWRANMKETLRLVLEWLKETAGRPKEQKFVWEEVSPYIKTGSPWGDEHAKVQKDFFEAVEKADKIHPWTKNMVEGCYYDALAWKLRGSGYADTVTEEGWRGFNQNIAKAAKCFTKAWELDRTVPDAAAQMIYVVNSGAKSDLSPRDWFDRAVQARMDFEPAYAYYVHHLRPQWHGSHDEMYDFGLECLNTKRFDTSVPFQLLTILTSIDWQLGHTGEIWRKEGVYDNVKTALEGMEKELPHSREFSLKKITPEWVLTLHGVIAAKAEQYDDARKAFDRVGMKLRKDAFAFAGGHFPMDGSRVYALTGKGGDEVRAFEEVIAGGKSGDPETVKSARKLLDSIAALAKEPQARAYIKHWRTHLRWREEFEKGEWVELIFDKDFSMWQMKMGTWTFEDPFNAVCDVHLLDSGYNSLSCEVPFEGPLEIECDVTSLDPRYEYMSAVLIGDIWDSDNPQTGCGFYICPCTNGHGVTVPKLKLIHYAADTQATDHLRIQAWDGAYLYYVNELEFPMHAAEGMTLGKKIELAGIRQRGPIGRTRFSNIRVRKLTAPPPPMTPDGDRLGYFDGLVAKNPQDAFLYYQRGLCRKSRRQLQEAEADLKKALSLAPDMFLAHLALARVEDSLRNFAAEAKELGQYLKIKPDDVRANNSLGWVLAACPDEKVRNGKSAVEHSRKVCELTGYADVNNLDTLAVACAENGDFAEAVKWGAKAVELAVDHHAPMKPELQSRLELYKAKKAYHDQ
jgi:hypothetical protein